MDPDIELQAKRPRLSYANTVPVVVGNIQKFTVPKGLITHRSRFFATAVSERWRKPCNAAPVKLDDEDPAIFDLYLHCVYRNVLDVQNVEVTLGGEKDLSQNKIYFLRMARTYVLADKLEDRISAGIIIKAMIKFSDEVEMIPDLPVVEYVCGNTMDDCPLQRLIVDFYVYSATPQTFKNIMRQDGEIDLTDFLCAILARKTEIESNSGESLVREVLFLEVMDRESSRYLEV